MVSVIKQFLTRFRYDTRGGIAIMAAFAMPVLFALGGAGYDFGIQQMAWKNAQFAADIAATSAAGARRFEPWGRQTPGSDGEYQRSQQERRVGMLYGINSRGYNIDPNFVPVITVQADAGSDPDFPYMVTHVTGNSAMPTGFVQLVGVDSLPYTIDTTVRHRVPGAKVTFDISMFLDYTTSMTEQARAGGGRKIDILKGTATSLVDWVMCGNEQGTDCDPENDNRLSFIPYTITSIGLDVCDLPVGDPQRPEACDCQMPRAFPGGQDAWESDASRCRNNPGTYSPYWPTCRPEQCRPACDRVDAQGRPASDPESAYFTCHCWKNSPNGKPLPPAANEPVAGKYPCGFGDPKIWVDNLLDYPKPVSKQCIAFCQKDPGSNVSGDGCCNPCDKSPNFAKYSLQWAQCTMNRRGSPNRPLDRENFGCGCAQPESYYQVTESQPASPGCDAKVGEYCVVFGAVPQQTYQCHHSACTCSCSAAGGGIDPCGATPPPPQCLPPEGPLLPPPPNPGLGFLEDMTPQAQFASAVGIEESQLYSAVYNPDEDVFGNKPNVILAAGIPVTDMAISLKQCQDYGPGIAPGSCGARIKDAMAQEDYLENFGTTSAAAFTDFAKYVTYRDYMRPSADPEANMPALNSRTQNVVIWISDGENTRFTVNGVNMPRPGLKRVSGQLAWQQIGNAANHGPDWDMFVNNCYLQNGTEVKNAQGETVSACPSGTCSPNAQCPAQYGGKTARQWADERTIQQCDALRDRVSPQDGQKRMSIYTIFIAGTDVDDPEILNATRLMTRCSYGTAYDSDATPPNQMKKFFLVENFSELRAAFAEITRTLDAIRIVR